MKARYLMTKEVVTGPPEMPVEQAKELLLKHNLSGMPVVDKQGHVVGVFSLTDMIKKQDTTIGQMMTSPAVTAEENVGIEGVAMLMATNDLDRIPVVKNNQLVGIISRGDIVRYVATRHAWIESEEQHEDSEKD